MTNDIKNIKIGIFGAKYSGKKSISLRYIKNEYTVGYIPTIEDVFEKTIQIDNENIHISLINTDGQDDFGEMRNIYYRQSQGFIFVLDIMNEDSIEYLKTIYNDIISCVDDKNNINCVLAANKSDLRDDNRSDIISVDEYNSLEKYFKCKIFEVSSKTGMNIDNMFDYLIKQIISKQAKPNQTNKESPTNQKTSKKKQSFWSKLFKRK
ncbi:hypothetical protein M9Y10_021301 [Tritrichomonas musculus]|uniref:Uncharacterized protein n=1 Tax=Tritrichomonas musculus TaxID=1915356 RepID=A0ABR2HFW1_9EUKA